MYIWKKKIFFKVYQHLCPPHQIEILKRNFVLKSEAQNKGEIYQARRKHFFMLMLSNFNYSIKASFWGLHLGQPNSNLPWSRPAGWKVVQPGVKGNASP